MDYEKKYNEALELARANHKFYKEHTEDVKLLEAIFPELAESEDERIRKAIVKSIEDDSSVYEQEVSKEQMLDWLEKQKEQKPVLPGFDSMTPEEKMNHPLYLEGFDMGREVGKVEAEQKPAEWSEEDEKIRGNLMSLLANMRGDRITEETYQKYYPWLKSLKPQAKVQEFTASTDYTETFATEEAYRKGYSDGQKVLAQSYPIPEDTVLFQNGVKEGRRLEKQDHWKPSEEQMAAFTDVITYIPEFFKPKSILRTLLEDLKKLKEE